MHVNQELLGSSCCLAGILLLFAAGGLPGQSSPDLSQQIAGVMSQGPSGKAHQRFIHAKGIVCEGMFQATSGAGDISRAAHLQGGKVPVTVRFSDGAPDINVADNSPDASPRGMAIRFEIGKGTDIMAISHNGFVVGTGEDFLELEKAIAATDQSKPHPWPIETFLGARPAALKFVQDPKPVPVSFVTESFYANDAFIFVNSKGQRQAGRYQIIPVGGVQYLSGADAKAKPADFLREELAPRLAQTPAKFRLVLQLAKTGDPTKDSS